MMRSLAGIIPASDSDIVDKKTELRFKDKSKFRTPEALIIHEQKIINDDRLLEACQREYNTILVTPPVRYVPKEIIDMFSKYRIVVLDYDVASSIISIGTIPEFEEDFGKIFIDGYVLKTCLIPIYFYVELYTKQFHEPDFLAQLPTRDKLDFIVNEAVEMGAKKLKVSIDVQT